MNDAMRNLIIDELHKRGISYEEILKMLRTKFKGAGSASFNANVIKIIQMVILRMQQNGDSNGHH